MLFDVGMLTDIMGVDSLWKCGSYLNTPQKDLDKLSQLLQCSLGCPVLLLGQSSSSLPRASHVVPYLGCI